MSKETLGIVLAIIVGVMGFAIWLADKSGKSTPVLTIIVLAIILGLCLCGAYLIPWVWTGDNTVEKTWKIFSVTSLVLIGVTRFGIWVWPTESKQREPLAVISSDAPQAKVTPELAFSFRQIGSTRTSPPLSGGDTTIIIVGDLSNNGKMPTGVKEWSLKIVPAGEQSELVGALVGGNFTTLSMRSDSGQEEVLSWKDDYLPEILARKSINWGETIPGFVVFVVPKADFERVKLKGTRYAFGFQDALGKQYNFSFVGKGGDQPAQYFPGLSRPPVSPSTQPKKGPTVIFKGTEITGNETVVRSGNPNLHVEFDGTKIKGNKKVFDDVSQEKRGESLKDRASKLSAQILTFLTDRQANEPPSPRSDTWEEDTQKGLIYGRQTMALYTETFSARVIAIHDEFARQGFRDSELDSYYEHPTNPIGIRIVGEHIGAMAEKLKQ